MFVRVNLEERVERQELDARAPVQNVSGKAYEDLLHYTVRTVVAILEGLTEQEAVAIHQAVIDPPRIDADAVEGARELPRFTLITFEPTS